MTDAAEPKDVKGLPALAAKQVHEQWRVLDRAIERLSPTADAATIAQIEATKLEMLTIRESTVLQVQLVKTLRLTMSKSSLGLQIAMRELQEASDKTGNRLAFWTMWLVFGTFLLGAATAALVGVEIWARLHEQTKEATTIAIPVAPERPLSVGPAK